MQASPRGGAPGCLSNPGSPVWALRCRCHSNRAERGVSSLHCRAGISGPHGPLRTCGQLSFLGLSCCWGPEPRRLWARPALPPASRPVLEGPQLLLPDREGHDGKPGEDLLQGHAAGVWVGSTQPSKDPFLPNFAQLTLTGPGPMGSLGRTVSLDLDPVAIELL